MSEVYGAMNSSRMRGGGGPYGGQMGGFNSRPSPYDSRDRYGGQNRYSMGGRGGRKFHLHITFTSFSFYMTFSSLMHSSFI